LLSLAATKLKKYQMLHVQFLSSWWWAGKPPETCWALTTIKDNVLRCILLVAISIQHTSDSASFSQHHVLDTRRRPASFMTWFFYLVSDTSSTPRRMVILPRVGHQALVCENRALCVNMSFEWRLYRASCLLNPHTHCHIQFIAYYSFPQVNW
jgi:hypothetical protein